MTLKLNDALLFLLAFGSLWLLGVFTLFPVNRCFLAVMQVGMRIRWNVFGSHRNPFLIFIGRSRA